MCTIRAISLASPLRPGTAHLTCFRTWDSMCCASSGRRWLASSECPSAACEMNDRIETLLPLARFYDLGLGLIKLRSKHLEVAAVRTGHFDPSFLAVDKDPFRVSTAACADDVALAPLGIDCACIFHAFCSARVLPIAGDLDAHDRTRRLLNDSVSVSTETPERRLQRAASNNQQIGPLLPGFFSYGARNLTHGNS